MTFQSETLMTDPAHVTHDRFNWAMLGVVAAILTQSAVLIAWGAKLDERVATLEQRASAVSGLGETVARVDERTATLVTATARIEQRLNDQDQRR